jgi:DNA-binding beta-propeller fold protein YncE/O-antigen ligase
MAAAIILSGAASASPWPLLGALAAAGLLAAIAFVWWFPLAATLLWLAATGAMAEIWLGDLLGAGSAITAALRSAGLGIATVAMLRWGARFDLRHPVAAYLAIFAAGKLHGLHPNLDMAESLRSLLGSAAPFAFGFARLPPRFCQGVRRMVQCVPALAVIVGLMLAIGGLRPLITLSGGLRLAGAGHPAFLAGFALTAVWASLLGLLRHGARADWLMLLLNLAILGLTGARAPLALALAGTAAALLYGPGERGRRVPLLLAIGFACLGTILLAAFGDGLRILDVLRGETRGLSGRDMIWPVFDAAWSQSPWFGWGIGTGKVLLPMDDPLAQLLGTNAAHNEYLRLGVEGGWLGLGLFCGLFVAWVLRQTALMDKPGRFVMRLAMAAFAIHAYTDNVLIATTASALFIWVAAESAEAEAGGEPPREDKMRYPLTLLCLLIAAFCVAAPLRAEASGMALVLNSSGASISVIDMTAGREVRRIPVLREPHHVALSHDHKSLLVGDTGGNEILFLDPMTGALQRRVPAADPYQIGFSPNGKFLTVTGLARNQVDIYDAASMELLHRFPLKAMPSHLAYAPDNSVVYVSLQETDRLVALDLKAMTVQWDVPVGHTPAGVMWLNGKVLVANMGEDNFMVVNPADGHVERKVVTGRGAHQLFLSPDRKIVYVNNRVEGTTVAVNAATLVPERTYKIGGGPDCIDFAPGGDLWITERWAQKVAVLNPVSGDLHTIDVGRSPHGLFLNAAAP